MASYSTGFQINNENVPDDIFDAIENNDIQKVTTYLDNGLSVDATDSIGISLLFWAVSDNRQEIVELLLKRGANPNKPEVNGITPLMDAASGGNVKITKLLLRYGADTSLKDNFGDIAYDYASKQNFPETAKLVALA